MESDPRLFCGVIKGVVSFAIVGSVCVGSLAIVGGKSGLVFDGLEDNFLEDDFLREDFFVLVATNTRFHFLLPFRLDLNRPLESRDNLRYPEPHPVRLRLLDDIFGTNTFFHTLLPFLGETNCPFLFLDNFFQLVAQPPILVILFRELISFIILLNIIN